MPSSRLMASTFRPCFRPGLLMNPRTLWLCQAAAECSAPPELPGRMITVPNHHPAPAPATATADRGNARRHGRLAYARRAGTGFARLNTLGRAGQYMRNHVPFVARSEREKCVDFRARGKSVAIILCCEQRGPNWVRVGSKTLRNPARRGTIHSFRGTIAQLVRASALHAECRRFESCWSHHARNAGKAPPRCSPQTAFPPGLLGPTWVQIGWC